MKINRFHMMKNIILSLFFMGGFIPAYSVEVELLTGKEKLIHPPFLKEGEYLKFKVSYLNITGGYGVLEVSPQPKNGRVVFNVRAWTTPFVSTIYTLLLNNEARVEPSTLYTQYYREDKIERQSIKPNVIEVFPDKKEFVFQNFDPNPDKFGTKTVKYEARGYDVISSFYLTRCLDLKNKDKKIWFTSFFRDQIHETEVKVIRREKIRTKYGKLDTIVIVPRMKFRGLFMNKGDIVIYLTDDEYLCPVLMESKLSVGYFRAKLVERYPLPKGWKNPGRKSIKNESDLERVKREDKKYQDELRKSAEAFQKKKNPNVHRKRR